MGKEFKQIIPFRGNMGYKHNKNMLDLTRIQRNQNQNHELFRIIHVAMEIYIKNFQIYI